MYKLFTVIIRDTFYNVYNIEGKEHEGYNDMPKNWWLYFSDELPEGLLPPVDSPHWEPFSKSVKRRIWEIKFREYNSVKDKWDELMFTHGCTTEMWCNKRLVYQFTTLDLSFAMAKVQYLQVVMSEHCYNFFEPEENEGRKIYWYGLPATVKVKQDTWEIGVIPDYTTGLSKLEWWKELERRQSKLGPLTDEQKEDLEMDVEDFSQDIQSDYINWGDALSDRHIDWFRY